MEQVILNLVVNAKDAMPKGGRVVIETRDVYLDEDFTSKHLSVSRGHYVLLSVADTGMGMDAVTAAKIFDPFFTTKPVGKGTGLGLTTTYGIVKQAKGTIWVYSELNQGTVFKIYLPVANAQAVTAPAAPVPASTAAVGGMQTILLVENDASLRAGFSGLLQRKGYTVLVASNGKEALALCAQEKRPIHLLLTDVVMPGMGGFELAKKIVDLRGDIRVLYMSGYTNDTIESEGLRDLAQLAFIQKPFTMSELAAKIQDTLK